MFFFFFFFNVNFCLLTYSRVPGGGGILVQRSIRERAAEMGLKVASWYNDDPLFSAKTGINMGHIFKIYLNWHEKRPNFINLIPKFPKYAWKLNNFGK